MNELEVDVSMEDAHAGILEFVEQDSKLGEGNGGGYGESASTARYARSGVRSDPSLPALLPVYFRPAPLPDDGLMLSDGGCFTHLFIPAAFLSEAGSMARRIVFVIGVSGSMSGEKLREAKASFAAMIDLLDERHTLLVQPFSNEGTEELWGPRPATAANKDGAKEFVMACLGGFGRSYYYDYYVKAKCMGRGPTSGSSAKKQKTESRSLEVIGLSGWYVTHLKKSLKYR